jgi:hypothetical protein
MADTIQRDLYESFLAIAGQQSAMMTQMNASLVDVIAQAHDLLTGNPAPQTKTVRSTSSSSTDSSGSSGGGVVSTIVEGMLGLPALIGGLFGLLGGDNSSTPAPLVKFAMPAAMTFQAAESQGQVTGVDYDQMGVARTYSPTPSAKPEQLASGSTTGSGSTPLAPQITVNVQAMDARSFLDRSNDIALAVRDAMLNLNAINDVVNEL